MNHMQSELDRFLGFTMDHPHLSEVLGRALAISQSRSRADIIIVTGPTGVGKTTLAAKLEAQTNERYASEMAHDRGMIPVVHVSAATTGDSGFLWKDFYIRLLSKIDAVDPQLKLPITPSQFDLFAHSYMIPRSLPGTGALERHLEVAVKHRKVKMLLVDEANQMFAGCKYAELQRRFEALKSLSLNTGLTIVLVGTYDLLQIRDQSAQLVRRSEIIHLRRYQCEDEVDRRVFGGVLNTFARRMPFRSTPNLLADLNYFCLTSVGCVGILKRWLNTVVEEAVRNGIVEPTMELFRQCAPTVCEAQTILTEASEGERKLVDIPFSVLQSQSSAQFKQLKEMALQAEELGQRLGRASQKPKVGERKAKRDPLGTTYDAEQTQFNFA